MSTTYSKIKVAVLLAGLALALLLITFLGCKGAGETVYIQVESEPIIRVSQGTTVAILPLLGEDYEVDAHQVTNEEVHRSIDQLTSFLIISDEELNSALESEEFADRKPTSMQFAYDLGKELRVNYVIYGSYEIFAEEYSELGYAPNERYTADQPYAPYIDKGPSYSMRDWDVTIRYHMNLSIKVLNVERDQLAMDKTYTAMAEETYKSSQLPMDIYKLKIIYEDLLNSVVDQFRYQLTPHGIDEERYVLAR